VKLSFLIGFGLLMLAAHSTVLQVVNVVVTHLGRIVGA